jgi:hypothetical protein
VPDDDSLKIPHMGWNTLHKQDEHALLDGIETGPDGLHAYFVHSYALTPEPGGCAGADRLWRPRHRDGGARQRRRHAVPSREEPEARPEADRQFPQVAP